MTTRTEMKRLTLKDVERKMRRETTRDKFRRRRMRRAALRLVPVEDQRNSYVTSLPETAAYVLRAVVYAA